MSQNGQLDISHIIKCKYVYSVIELQTKCLNMNNFITTNGKHDTFL